MAYRSFRGGSGRLGHPPRYAAFNQSSSPRFRLSSRGTDGRLSVARGGSDSFAARQWLAADGDARPPTDRTIAEGIRCDPAGCVGRLADGSLVALARTIEAFEEDCRRAAVIATARTAPAHCAALVVDREVLRQSGAISLRRTSDGFAMIAARPKGYDRPWARARSATNTPAVTPRTIPPDATPRLEDIEPGD